MSGTLLKKYQLSITVFNVDPDNNEQIRETSASTFVTIDPDFINTKELQDIARIMADKAMGKIIEKSKYDGKRIFKPSQASEH